MNKLIFFVDDDKLILNLLEYTLNNKDDYDVRTYLSGEDCIKDLELKPDLIVLDHYFENPGKTYTTGLDILQKIKAIAPKTPVLILSNQEDKVLMGEYLTKGATKFIPKNDYFIDNLMEAFESEFSKS